VNADQLEGCLKLIEAYYPGDWTPERLAVWADQFAGREYQDVTTALKEMAAQSEFASTVAFVAAFQGVRRRAMNEPATKEIEGPKVHSSRMFAGLRAVFGLERARHDHRHGADRCAVCSAHDLDAHKRDRVSVGPSQCGRCRELADVFYEGAEA